MKHHDNLVGGEWPVVGNRHHLKYATHFKRHSQPSLVMVNLPTACVDCHVAFGGNKASSYGP